MDVREKLVEILKTKYDHFCDQCGINKDSKYTENLASYLIANGVTVQEWISVKDRLPEESGYYLVFTDIGRIALLAYSKKYQAFNAHDDSYLEEYVIPVTHWMPMPEQPKGE